MQLTKDQVNKILNNAPQGADKKKILDGLIMRGYELEGVDSNQVKQSMATEIAQPKPKLTLGNRISEAAGDIGDTFKGIARTSAERANNVSDLETKMNAGERGVIETKLKQTGQFLGAGADAIGEVFKGGVKVLASQEREDKLKELLGELGQQVGQIKTVQDVNNWYQNLPEDKKETVDAIGGAASLASEFIGVGVAKRGTKQVVNQATNVAQTGLRIADQALDSATDGLNQTFKAGNKILPKSEDIMNRVARLTPTQARKFETVAGKTHGQYLKETGNFGTPDEILKVESKKFAESIKSVDDSLAKLDGNFKDGVLDDVLGELQDKAIATSTKNVQAPYLERVNSLISKHETEGLSMSEVNELKRLYERNVKLGYNKLIDAEKIQRATNLDTALRDWQITKAEELGFGNLKELNKQTQLSKQLINSLGDQVVGQNGLNGVSLTDWIMLSGGDPTAVGGFLTKKFFSSKKIQSKIAEWLNDTEVEKIIKPKITPLKKVQGVIPENYSKVKKLLESKLSKAPESKVYLDKKMDELIANSKEILVAKAPLKSLERSIEKTIIDNGGDVEKIYDIARGTIIPLTPKAQAQAIKAMESLEDVVRVKIQTPEKFMGYSGRIYNIKTPNGLIGETQIVSPKMVFGKNTPEYSKKILGEKLFNQIKKETGLEPGLGHKIYEQYRILSPEEQLGVTGSELLKKSFDYYNKLR